MNLDFSWMARDVDYGDLAEFVDRINLIDSDLIKVLLIGGPKTGKSALMRAWRLEPFAEAEDSESVPVANWMIHATIQDNPKTLTLWDTSFDDLSTTLLLLARETDVGILCLPSGEADRAAIDSAKACALLFQQRCAGVPVVLVGTKADLRSDDGLFANAPGEAIACSLGLQSYKECSARSGAGLEQVLIEATRLALARDGSDRLSLIRHRATEICIALDALELPALVSVVILDAALDNNVRMAAKWSLVTAVKHFRQPDRIRIVAQSSRQELDVRIHLRALSPPATDDDDIEHVLIL